MAEPRTPTHSDLLRDDLRSALRQWGAERTRSGSAALRVLESPSLALPLYFLRDLSTAAGILQGYKHCMLPLSVIFSATRGSRDHVELAPVVCECLHALFTPASQDRASRCATLAIVTAMHVVSFRDPTHQARGTAVAPDDLPAIRRGESGTCFADHLEEGGDVSLRALAQAVGPAYARQWLRDESADLQFVYFVSSWAKLHFDLPRSDNPRQAPPVPFCGFSEPASQCACDRACTSEGFEKYDADFLPRGTHAEELRFVLEISIYTKCLPHVASGRLPRVFHDAALALESIRTGDFKGWASLLSDHE